MPRGVRKVVPEITEDFETQLKSIDEKISALKSERQEVLAKKRESDLVIISEFMAQKGLTPMEVVDMLSPAVAAAMQSPTVEA